MSTGTESGGRRFTLGGARMLFSVFSGVHRWLSFRSSERAASVLRREPVSEAELIELWTF